MKNLNDTLRSLIEERRLCGGDVCKRQRCKRCRRAELASQKPEWRKP